MSQTIIETQVNDASQLVIETQGIHASQSANETQWTCASHLRTETQENIASQAKYETQTQIASQSANETQSACASQDASETHHPDASQARYETQSDTASQSKNEIQKLFASHANLETHWKHASQSRPETQEVDAKNPKKEAKVKQEKQALDKMSIREIENQLKQLHGNIQNQQEQFYETLEYLEMTKRFRENQLYKTSTFEQYIGDVFMLRMGTYMAHRSAYANHSDIAKEFGPRLVTSVKKKCGAIEAQKVFNEIKEAKAKKKDRFRREDIAEVVKKHERPMVSSNKKKSGIITDQKGLIDRLQKQHEADQKTIKALNVENRELKDQIDRLKKTVEFYKKQMSMPLCDIIGTMKDVNGQIRRMA